MSNPGDICQVNVDYVTAYGAAENTFGFVNLVGVSNGLADLASAFRTAMIKSTSGGLLYNVVNTTSVSTIRVQDIKPGTAATYEDTSSSVVGAISTDGMPNQCAVLLTLRTGVKGRSYRGRVYLPSVADGSATGSILTPTAITAYTTIPSQLLAVFGPGGSNGTWQLAVISRYANFVKRGTPIATAVTSIDLDTVVRTQRRRVYGVGM